MDGSVSQVGQQIRVGGAQIQQVVHVVNVDVDQADLDVTDVDVRQNVLHVQAVRDAAVVGVAVGPVDDVLVGGGGAAPARHDLARREVLGRLELELADGKRHCSVFLALGTSERVGRDAREHV